LQARRLRDARLSACRLPPASIVQENAFDISHTSFVHHGFFGRREDATPGAPAAPLSRGIASCRLSSPLCVAVEI